MCHFSFMKQHEGTIKKKESDRLQETRLKCIWLLAAFKVHLISAFCSDTQTLTGSGWHYWLLLRKVWLYGNKNITKKIQIHLRKFHELNVGKKNFTPRQSRSTIQQLKKKKKPFDQICYLYVSAGNSLRHICCFQLQIFKSTLGLNYDQYKNLEFFFPFLKKLEGWLTF